LPLPAFARAAMTAAELRALIKRVEKQYWSTSSRGTMRMEVSTTHWKRSLTMEAWSRGDDEFLVRVKEPAKDQGVATLKTGTDIWNYLPKVDRTIKVPSSLMGEGWMGSHLTNDDLVKESRVEDDYTFRLLEEKSQGGRGLYVIEALPRPDAAVVWGKLVYTIDRKSLLPVATDYYDEEGKLAREMRFEAERSYGGRVLPSRVVVIPQDKPGEQTVMTYLDLTFDLNLPADFFSLKNLRKQ
jgi:outer membrane lipoprotein-sorting protein